MAQYQDAGIIGAYDSGVLDSDQLNARIGEAWRDLLANEGDRADVAKLLELDPAVLSEDTPPIVATSGPSGIVVSGIIISAGTAFLMAAAGAAGKEFGSQVGKAAATALIAKIQELWQSRIRRKVNPPGSEALGDKKSDDDQG